MYVCTSIVISTVVFVVFCTLFPSTVILSLSSLFPLTRLTRALPRTEETLLVPAARCTADRQQQAPLSLCLSLSSPLPFFLHSSSASFQLTITCITCQPSACNTLHSVHLPLRLYHQSEHITYTNNETICNGDQYALSAFQQCDLYHLSASAFT